MISAGDFKNGITLEIDGNVCQIVEFQHVKPGKGAAFVRTKYKNIITGSVLEKSFRPTEKFPAARIERVDMQYLYDDGDLYYFMNVETYDQVAEEVKEARRDEIMELQQEISYDKGTDRIGQELLVMIEGKVADESAYIGRTYGDAPKVDGYIFVQTGELLMTGDFAKVRVTGALEYDLIGELADEYTE